jgi:hypothetical protein
MFEDRIREICQALGYEPVEFLLSSSGTEVASVHAREPAGSMVVVRFVEATATDAGVAKAFEAQRWNTGRYATAYVTGPQTAGAVKDPGRDEQVLQEMNLRWEVGGMAGGQPINPILDFGLMRKHFYQVRPFYPATLHHLIERQVIPSHPVLFRVVDQLWAALAFLHQSLVNQPHGALSTHNVGFSSARVTEAQVCLLDLKDTPETKRAELKRRDFQDLGMLIYQFACSLERPVDAVDAAMRCPNASWKQLGGKEKEMEGLGQTVAGAGLVRLRLRSGRCPRTIAGFVVAGEGRLHRGGQTAAGRERTTLPQAGSTRCQNPVGGGLSRRNGALAGRA